MIDFKVDTSICIRCGACAHDCVSRIIKINEYPMIVDESACIKCQHCMAICPTGAISILGCDPKDSEPVCSYGHAADLRRLIMGRRSVRSFVDEDLPEEVLEELLNTASYAPTGANASDVSFHLVAGREEMSWLRNRLYSELAHYFRAVNPAEMLERRSAILISALNGWEKHGRDRLLCHAPYLVVTSAGPASITPAEDCLIALSTLDLYAQALGLGTLWNGMFMWALRDFAPELKQKLGIGPDHSPGYALIFGKPAVHYKRSSQRRARIVRRDSL